jgi:hypothetical protein
LDQANKRKAAAAAAPAASSLSKKAAAPSQFFASVRGKDWQVHSRSQHVAPHALITL